MTRPALEEVLFLHELATEKYGGSPEILNLGSVEAAVFRPWGQSFRRDHFPSPFEKAAAIFESINRRHAFQDGNKRTSLYAAAYLLEGFGFELDAESDAARDLAKAVASDATEVTFQEIAAFFEGNSVEKA
ncbi:MAG: type II toxin-antitoxin system death-on-curing family toxin [Rubrobacter sp.]|nr:type II toxin-antitoxin system death-on-curing family toxin [Rubrobacter sp.]